MFLKIAVFGHRVSADASSRANIRIVRISHTSFVYQNTN